MSNHGKKENNESNYANGEVLKMSLINSLVLLFASALAFSLILTPAAKLIGIKLGAMDIPMERKIHTQHIPRIGGLAVFLSLVITFLLAYKFLPHVSESHALNFNTGMGLLGGMLALLCGLWDDFRRLRPWPKLFCQIIAASIAFMGGAKISAIVVGGHGIYFNFFFSYVITVFWFLLFINAINLIDGLDGLAGGLVFFTSLVMTFSSYVNGDYLSSFYFAALGGAVLGFLRYNFNPAVIFLGDGGSYFLGYSIALLSIQSSTKSQVGVLMLIPLLALGVPIFDSILSPIRRFIRGRSMFHADKGHIHHHLLRMGLSSRNAVLTIYGVSMALCLLAILLITFRGRGLEAFVLAFLLFGMIFLVRKLGYMEYLAYDKFYGWFQDMTDVAGISNDRRSFLAVQIAIGKSLSMDELWENVIESLRMLKFKRAQLALVAEPVREWRDDDGMPEKEAQGSNDLFKIEIPLRDNGDKDFLGKLTMAKDLRQEALQPYTIRRIEHLRRTLIPNIKRLRK